MNLSKIKIAWSQLEPARSGRSLLFLLLISTKQNGRKREERKTRNETRERVKTQFFFVFGVSYATKDNTVSNS